MAAMSRAKQNKTTAAISRSGKKRNMKESASMVGQRQSSEVNSKNYNCNDPLSEITPDGKKKMSVRDWFNTLSSIARAEAIGFVDHHLLNTLCRTLRSQTLSQSLLPPEGREATSSLENSEKLDWLRSINAEGVGQVLESHDDEQLKLEVFGNSSAMEVTSNLQSDDYAKNSEECNDAGLCRAEASSPGNSLDLDNNFQQNSIFDRLCCVFPSTFAAADTQKVSLSYPFVTIDAIFLEDENLGDTLLSFDKIAKECFGSEFLSFDLSESVSDSEGALTRFDVCEIGSRVPVFAVVVARLEQAAYRSYSRFLDQTLKKTVELEGDRSHEGQALNNIVTTDGFLHSTGFLNDIHSLWERISAVSSTLDTTSIRFCMEPFFDAFNLSDQFSDTNNYSKHLVFTQLIKVLASAQTNESINFERLDTAIDNSIQRIRSSETGVMDTNIGFALSSSSQRNVESDAIDGVLESESKVNLCSTDVEVVNDVQELHEDLQWMFQKESSELVDIHSSNHSKSRKKKKKTKKRKNRKGSTTLKDQPHLASDVTSSVHSQNVLYSNDEVDIQENTNPTTDDYVSKTAAATSFDSADSEISMKSETSAPRDSTAKQETNDNITISRFDGRIIVANSVAEVASTPGAEERDTTKELPASERSEHDDDDPWETVETKSKTNRKKGNDRAPQSNSRHGNHTHALSHVPTESQLGNKKTKNVRTGVSRRRTATRKMVREILLSAIDKIDEESQKLKVVNPAASRSFEAPKPPGNPWKNGPPGRIVSQTPKENLKPLEPPKKEKTLRDVVLGIHIDSPVSKVAAPKTVDASRPVDTSISKEHSHKKDSGAEKNNQIAKGKVQTAPNADQNTAPTYQETVSAVSTSSNAVLFSKEIAPSPKSNTVKSDSSSTDTDEAPPKAPVKLGKNVSPTPPLPTLLNPEIANSSTSSVASSLEAPHVVHSHHHSKSAQHTTDVGYHLLDVCDRLSRDMNLFMSRRALALNPRRRERGALLTALQESVSSLWPGRCHVELYGSCAIQLDLPSSDLDVVVVGLDRNIDMLLNQTIAMQSNNRGKSAGNDSVGTSVSQDDGSLSEDVHPNLPTISPYVLMPGIMNADRVVRLAAEVERQPWAVQVKAIPTASVPVIKILADPSRISTSARGLDWIPNQQVGALEQEVIDNANEHGIADFARQGISPPTAFLPWRGSDIVKGLLALDITFEGPGHGGIGSTEFSSRVITETCHEFGLYPEATPFVQVLLVLKELLAQRKLNEPYSGGLSSYALLLLVLALVRERAVIKNEIERVERQGKAMSIVAPTSFVRSDHGVADSCRSSNSSDTYETRHIQPKEKVSEKTTNHNGQKTEKATVIVVGTTDKPEWTRPQNKAQSNTQTSTPQRSGSWANVAKKGAGNQNPPKQNHPNTQLSSKPQHGKKNIESKQKPSFAAAVANTKQLNGNSDRSVSASTVEKPKSNVNVIEIDKKLMKNDEIVGSTIDVASTNGARNTKDQITISHNSDGPGLELERSTLLEPAFYPQGVSDIIEVLCSGETTAGKLLMHFFLFYGQYFDAQTTAIDISGKHVRDSSIPFSQHFSPFVQRKSPGSIDPVTGMLIIDPIVVYDPLEGAENNNVARRCFCWNSVRWIFSQSYTTLSSAVERSATPPTSPNGKNVKQGNGSSLDGRDKDHPTVLTNQEVVMDPRDPSSPLLSCLLSF